MQPLREYDDLCTVYACAGAAFIYASYYDALGYIILDFCF